VCRLKAFSLGAALVFLTGLAVLVGRLFDIPRLTRVVAGFTTMRPNMAIGLMFTATALAVLNREAKSTRTFVARILAALVLALGLCTLAEYLFQTNLVIDDWLIANAAAELKQRRHHHARPAEPRHLLERRRGRALWPQPRGGARQSNARTLAHGISRTAGSDRRNTGQGSRFWVEFKLETNL
jgi:hypothetical protein